ncbi:leucine-rich repeat, immunoglobulin-like domain and transmembrane domain-containing protein 3 isoform X1 [Diachasmimorpha longicaudata]|uniref:leucine-rich repeat, immunoglobulin-like domain and transmembrane domain-containing protein 3 isoform X1 n=1 Tax=Diachasmimorpha longicaudata TaxID=58733 RepID=UPI0030B8A815
MLESVVHRLRGRHLLALLLIISAQIFLIHSAAFPDWTDCPAVCRCRWTSGKKSAFCPDAGLTSLPASLDPEMQVLDLSGNQIPALQAEIFKRAGLVNLQKVFLRNAGIHEIHPDAFRDMRILVEVDLSDNHVTSLEPNTFLGNERLRILTLSGNPLKRLKSRQFPELGHLRNLELQRCGLTEIHGLAFTGLTGLESLKLDNNQLLYLESRTLSVLPSLKTLTLDHNKWSCDCRLKSFRSWLIPETPRKLYSVSQICSGPPRLQKRRWEDTKPTEFACSPEVQLFASKVQEEVNGNLSLSCSVSGDPEPELWWLFNGSPINLTRPDNPTSSIIVTSNSNFYRSSESDVPRKWSNITIYNTSDSDAGEYSCHAKNLAGADHETVNIVVPRVLTAPTLSQTDNWLLWVSLAGGGAVALCAFILAVLLTVCLCGNSRRRSRREKVKLQGSTSFGDQEKKLLDLSVTTTTPNTNDRGSGQGSLADTSCSPGDLELAERASICDAATVTVERLRPDCGIQTVRTVNCPAGFLPPPPEFTGGGVLPSGIFGNIFISVSMPQDAERCYPDLLDIPVHAPAIIDKCHVSSALPTGSIISSFATLPRRTLRADSGSQYDNMGPRVTATGSSTFSLTDDLRLSPPPPPPCFIKPPIEFVSL